MDKPQFGRGENPFVPATRVRAHLLRLQQQGIGLRSIAEACDISRSMLSGYRSGQRTRLTKYNADRILAVTEVCAKDWVLVDATKTLRQLAELRAEGFTGKRLAELIGQPNSNAPQVATGRYRDADEPLKTTVAVAAKVDKVWRQYMTISGT